MIMGIAWAIMAAFLVPSKRSPMMGNFMVVASVVVGLYGDPGGPRALEFGPGKRRPLADVAFWGTLANKEETDGGSPEGNRWATKRSHD